MAALLDDPRLPRQPQPAVDAAAAPAPVPGGAAALAAGAEACSAAGPGFGLRALRPPLQAEGAPGERSLDTPTKATPGNATEGAAAAVAAAAAAPLPAAAAAASVDDATAAAPPIAAAASVCSSDCSAVVRSSISAPVSSPASPAFSDDDAVGAEVMRVYRYLRRPGGPAPGIAHAATGLHVDMGLLTLSPAATLPGLALLHPSGGRWVDAEAGARAGHYFAFAGECLPRLVALSKRPTAPAGAAGPASVSPCEHCLLAATAPVPPPQLRAPLHFVDERYCGTPRFSFPFFLRARPDARLLAPLAAAAEAPAEAEGCSSCPPPVHSPKSAAPDSGAAAAAAAVIAGTFVHDTVLHRRPWVVAGQRRRLALSPVGTKAPAYERTDF